MGSIARWTEEWAKKKGLKVDYRPEATSTNDLAKAGQGDVFLTEHQTAGRGRGTNTWVDLEPGSTLLSSWKFALPSAPQPVASPLIGLALYEAALEAWPDLAWGLKPPNDLYLDIKKVAGLLIETVSQGNQHQLIIGLGINVSTHPEEIETAGHIEEEMDDEEVTQDDWQNFLDLWWAQLKKTLPLITSSAMGRDACEKLLMAINSLPFDEKYDEVRPDGGLRNERNVVPWTAL